MPLRDLLYLSAISAAAFAAAYLLVRHGWPRLMIVIGRQERRLDWVLNQQLLLGVSSRLAIGLVGAAMGLVGVVCAVIGGSVVWFFVGALFALALPQVVVRHLEDKRRKRLNEQVVHGATTLASGVRAGLNLVQSMQLLVRNGSGPIRQEFAQLISEYELGVDLNRAMRNASERIGSSYYRLLFTAVQAHRDRGGDMGQSLDRIAESIREIQRLEGRLDALTAQGRAQARFMGVMPIVIVAILYTISPSDAGQLLTDPAGRVILLIAAALIAVAYIWIHRIMQVDL